MRIAPLVCMGLALWHASASAQTPPEPQAAEERPIATQAPVFDPSVIRVAFVYHAFGYDDGDVKFTIKSPVIILAAESEAFVARERVPGTTVVKVCRIVRFLDGTYGIPKEAPGTPAPCDVFR